MLSGCGSVAIKELSTVQELAAVRALEEAVWQGGEGTPAALLKVFADHGGLVVGAVTEDSGALLGMAAGFPGRFRDHWYLHSHMMAISPPCRSQGLGRRLKAFQVQWVRAHHMDFVGWTFDPLQLGNALFNLRVLRARVELFQPNYYGVLGDSLNGAAPTHRFFVSLGSNPGGSAQGWRGAQGLLAIPRNIMQLRREDPGQAIIVADVFVRRYQRFTELGCEVLGVARTPAGRWCYVMGNRGPEGSE